MPELQKKITNIKDRLLGLDKSSLEYIHYSDVLKSLEKHLPKQEPVLRIHADPNDSICESCQ